MTKTTYILRDGQLVEKSRPPRFDIVMFPVDPHVTAFREVVRDMDRGIAAAFSGARPMNPPDRLALDPKSPFHDSAMIARGVAVSFKGVERFNVAEYCVSERWVRLIPAGGTYRNTVKLQGDVEVWFRS